MSTGENEFMEYLQLQGADLKLITKSELLARVRKRGYSVGERQLTFWVSEGLLPKSIRVGSRSGAYPAIVADLLAWVLRAKAGGLAIESIRELLPVWKLLMRARNARQLDLGELQYVARQHVTALEASYAIPAVVSDLLHVCSRCGANADMTVLMKDGTVKKIGDKDTTIGFAIARNMESDDETAEIRWIAKTRVTLAGNSEADTDPTTVILGIGPNVAVPPDSPDADESGISVHDHAEAM